MITVRIDFYDKKTEFGIDEKKMEFPDDIVFHAAESDEFTGDEFALAAAENQQISYIDSRPFAVTDEMKTYAIKQFPELKDKFNQYDYSFIGRHGLGPEYD